MRLTPARTQSLLLHCRGLGLLLVLLLMPFPASAQESAELVARGQTAFEAGHYARAASLFEQALADGEITEPRLYNLAVARFRAGQLEAARTRFEQILPLTDAPALIHYNLGLVALEQGRRAAARSAFSEALITDRDGRIAALASEQLERLGVTPRYAGVVEGQALIRAGGGYEDNLNLAGDRRVEAASVFQEAFAWGRMPVWRREALSVSVSGVASGRHYSGYEGADNGLAGSSLSLEYRWSPSLSLGAEGGIEWQWLDGDRVYRRNEAVFHLEWGSASGRLRAETGAADVRSGGAFPELGGSDAFAGIEYRRWVSDSLTATAGYSVTDEDREGLALANDFFSTSPVRHRIEGAAVYTPAERWLLTAGVVWRLSRYQEAEVRDGTRGLRRREERWRLKLGADWAFHKHWSLTLDGEWESNHARLASRNYRRMEARIGIRRAFGR